MRLAVRPSVDRIEVAKPSETNPIRRRPEPMMARTAAKMRAHLEHFSGTLSAGLGKPACRFVAEALYGIAARQSVRLTEIGRALEEPIALAKTETRLSRNLGRPELGDHVARAILREGGCRVGERTLLILDVSDVTKPYARKMEYLARVRAGSTGAHRRRLLAVPSGRRRE